MIVRPARVCIQWLMSFGIIYGLNHPYYPSKITHELSTQILHEIDGSLDQTLFDLDNIEINYDIENPLEIPCQINKNDFNQLEVLYKKDQFEFINTILWGFLQTNPSTKSTLDLLDEMIALSKNIDMSDSELDAFIQNRSNFKSFLAYKTRIAKLHGIDFDEYKAYRQDKLINFKKQQFEEQKLLHIPLVYKIPILKKISAPAYIEIHSGMNEDDILNHIRATASLKQPNLFEYLTLRTK